PCGFCGQAIQLPNKTLLHAEVKAPTGEGMRQTTANADPSIPKSSAYFQNTLFEPAPDPRNATSTVDSGTLSMPVDPGTFDLSIRTAAAPGYPWLVRPQLTIDAGEDVPQLDPLEVSFPVVLQGVLRDADGKPVPGALMRAWLPLISDPAKGVDRGIEIGETTT